MNHPDTRRWDQGWCLIAADANARDICPHPSSSPPFLLPHPLPRASELFPPSSRCGFWAGCTSWSNSECCFLSVGGMWRSWGPPTYARLATPGSPLFRVASIYLVRVFLSVYPTSRSLFNPGKGEGLGRQTRGCGVRLGYSGILSSAVISVWSWIFRFRTYKKE